MSTHKRNLKIEQGSDLLIEIELLDFADQPKDLSEHTARCKMRRHYDSANSIELTANINNTTCSLTLTSIQTSNIEYGRYVYDVELINNESNTVTRILEGIMTVTPEATR